jgi:hypothetical protein
MSNQVLALDPLTFMAILLRRQAERRLERAEQMTAPATRVSGLSRAEVEQQLLGLRRSAAELRRSADELDHRQEPLVVIEEREELAA